MNRILTLLFCCFSLLTIQAEDNRSEILKVSNWIDYIDEQLIHEFEEWYEQVTGEKVKVEYETYVMPDSMYNKIQHHHKDYDVTCPPEYLVERMLRHKLLLPIDTTDFTRTNTPNWLNGTSAYLDEAIQTFAEYSSIRVKDYAVPYQWGNTGVVFNTDYVSRQEVESWRFLFDPKYKGKIRIKDAFSDIYTILIIYANYDNIQKGRTTRNLLASSLTEENLSIVKEQLVRIRPQIIGWEFDEGRNHMAAGEDWLAVTWNGEAQWAIDYAKPDTHLDFLVPKEGSDLWVDCWVIPAYAKNVKAASYWINFFSRPDNALRCMRRTHWTSAIATPEMLAAVCDSTIEDTTDLSYFFGPKAKTVHLNRILYPDYSTIERMAIMRDIGNRQESMREIWNTIKAYNHDQTWLIIGLVAVAVVLILILAAVFYRYRYQKR